MQDSCLEFGVAAVMADNFIRNTANVTLQSISDTAKKKKRRIHDLDVRQCFLDDMMHDAIITHQVAVAQGVLFSGIHLVP